ncbi:MAG: hypothetical protein NXI31_23310 [bacterium]|nr:hypothetical protein [bacterium]
MIRKTVALLTTLAAFAAFAALTACGDTGNGKTGIPTAPPSGAAKALVLTADPGDAMSVVDAKVDGPKDAAIVTGRIREISAGVFAFTLIDDELAYCGEVNPEDCKTPWDFCCDSPKTITANLMAVVAHDENGKLLKTPALPDLRNLDVVKITGKLTQDEHGNFKLIANGIYRVERPQLPDGLLWPQ